MVMMMMMNVRNDEWLENENSSWFGCQVPTRTLIDPAGPLLSHCWDHDHHHHSNHHDHNHSDPSNDDDDDDHHDTDTDHE